MNIDKKIEPDQFVNLCINAETAEDIIKIAEYYTILWNDGHMVKGIYNYYIGWGIPDKHTCELIVNVWKKYPDKRIVDFGAGTGLFCRVLNYLGVPQDKLIAIDKIRPSHDSPNSKKFWPIYREYNYKIDVNDILFVAWGVYNVGIFIDDYVMRGGFCVIILGEMDGGCTLPSDYFIDEKTNQTRADWDIKLYEVSGPATFCNERLSINIRKQ